MRGCVAGGLEADGKYEGGNLPCSPRDAQEQRETTACLVEMKLERVWGFISEIARTPYFVDNHGQSLFFVVEARGFERVPTLSDQTLRTIRHETGSETKRC